MTDSNDTKIPMDPGTKLVKAEDGNPVDATYYRSLIGSLRYVWQHVAVVAVAGVGGAVTSKEQREGTSRGLLLCEKTYTRNKKGLVWKECRNDTKKTTTKKKKAGTNALFVGHNQKQVLFRCKEKGRNKHFCSIVKVRNKGIIVSSCGKDRSDSEAQRNYQATWQRGIPETREQSGNNDQALVNELLTRQGNTSRIHNNKQGHKFYLGLQPCVIL
ncbi:hypothetical protein Tco_0345093 [Tanacetum coccineum]